MSTKTTESIPTVNDRGELPYHSEDCRELTMSYEHDSKVVLFIVPSSDFYVRREDLIRILKKMETAS